MTDKEPTKEKIRELWKRCGLIYKDEVGYHGWYKPIGINGICWVDDELVWAIWELIKE